MLMSASPGRVAALVPAPIECSQLRGIISVKRFRCSHARAGRAFVLPIHFARARGGAERRGESETSWPAPPQIFFLTNWLVAAALELGGRLRQHPDRNSTDMDLWWRRFAQFMPKYRA